MMFLKKIFGNSNQKIIDGLYSSVHKVNSFEKEIVQLNDEQLKQKTTEFKNRLNAGATLDDIMAEAFAVVKEAGYRVLNQKHFDVQILGGTVLHQGKIAEMKTGEGKTLTSTLAAYLNALSGKGVHVITVNDYLAKRDAVWMGKLYNALGLSVGCIVHVKAYLYEPILQDKKSTSNIGDLDNFLKSVSRKEAYAADITYGTNNEFGFDYLRDNMCQAIEEQVQRGLNYAIIDEVDSILIDEARTPLIISAPAEQAQNTYYQFADLVIRLKLNADYTVDEKVRAVSLTSVGIAKVEQLLQIDNIYTYENIKLVHHLEQALKADVLFKKDRDYVVKDNEVIIVDEFTGRLMFGRRYSDGLHQAIEAKERVPIAAESITLATVTFQNYFRLYNKLSGMTGTAVTAAEELSKIYNLEVVAIPTHRPMIRKDSTDKIYKSVKGKFSSVVEEVSNRYKTGQPVLIGTISIENNEYLSRLLTFKKIPHNVLNAKNHEKEAHIISEAGKFGAVTVATNMAGRGVDIILGGTPPNKYEKTLGAGAENNNQNLTPEYIKWEEDHNKVVAVGGLHIIGTERHEARRIDDQLRGRSGRQGDPGSSQFFVSMEDDLMRIFGSDKVKGLMERFGLPEDTPIENKFITSALEVAQSKIEGHNFDIRKHLVEYDDIINKQREMIYKKRLEILRSSSKKDLSDSIDNKILVLIKDELKEIIGVSMVITGSEPRLDVAQLTTTINTIFNVPLELMRDLNDSQTPAEAIDILEKLVLNEYAQLEVQINQNGVVFKDIVKNIYLRFIDILWTEHLDSMDNLRSGIGLRSYGQKDPLVEYKHEAYNLFLAMLQMVRKQVVYSIYKVGVSQNIISSATTPEILSKDKLGRNDPCPCGSGKKYKRCHGA